MVLEDAGFCKSKKVCRNVRTIIMMVLNLHTQMLYVGLSIPKNTLPTFNGSECSSGMSQRSLMFIRYVTVTYIDGISSTNGYSDIAS